MAASAIDWDSVFDEVRPEPEATEEVLSATIADLYRPLSEAELLVINRSQVNPFPKGDLLYTGWKPFDPRQWRLPTRPLPESYRSFLRWSDGGSFASGDRRFDSFLSCTRLREYLLAYHVPQYMPLALPFAFDGGGCFYLFDMRKKPIRSEYPILFTGAGNLGYENAVLVATSFLEACKGRTDPRESYMR